MLTNKVEDLNKTFNEYFYKKFTFILDNKVLKEGRLKLFSMKSFNLKFFLVDGENIKTLEIPYPFVLNKIANGYIFDYRLEKFKLLKKTELLDTILEENNIKSRLYNKPLILKIE